VIGQVVEDGCGERGEGVELVGAADGKIVLPQEVLILIPDT